MSHNVCIFSNALLKGSTVGTTSQSSSNKWHTDTVATFRRLTWLHQIVCVCQCLDSPSMTKPLYKLLEFMLSWVRTDGISNCVVQ